jgi:serine/threonine-protein kinase
MELVNGEPLSAILERVGRLSAYNTMDVVAQAARALDIAHQAGIVHRDIKPGNLLIMGDGTTKITDFGIAKAREWGDPQLTATGIVMGTAMYVSPEQATGAVVTGSSDIYSLGVVAYECLAGEPPFVAEQPLAIAIMHKHDPVPPLPADVPRQVSDLVMAMLAKTPEGRPESALHVADRAEVLMTALRRGSDGLRIFETSDLPIVPDFPTATAPYYQDQDHQDYETERTASSPHTKRRLIAGGAGLAVCGIAAVVALLLSSGSNSPTLPGNTDSPSQSPKIVAKAATASETGTVASTGSSGTNVVTVPPSTSPQSPQPTTRQPTTQASKTTAPPTPTPPKTTPPTPPTTSASPTPTPSSTATSSASPSVPPAGGGAPPQAAGAS